MGKMVLILAFLLIVLNDDSYKSIVELHDKMQEFSVENHVLLDSPTPIPKFSFFIAAANFNLSKSLTAIIGTIVGMSDNT